MDYFLCGVGGRWGVFLGGSGEGQDVRVHPKSRIIRMEGEESGVGGGG